jgi:hypothetical protein
MRRDPKITVTMTKRCNCRGASSSGPRFVLTQKPGKNATEFTFTFVWHACDVCDEPWEMKGGK